MSRSIKSTFYKVASFFLCVAILHSCKKGDPGPAGATGPVGPGGPAGPIGAANVKYSDWFTPGPYTSTTVFGISNFTYDKAAPAITQPVLDSGLVLTFGKLLGYAASFWPTTQVAQLPISLTYKQGTTIMTDTWSARAQPQKLTINFINSVNYYTNISPQHQFRYIIIPGGSKISLTSGRKASLRQVAENYQYMSYSEICNALNIPE